MRIADRHRPTDAPDPMVGAAGARRALDRCCIRCGYGIAAHTSPTRCPMCGCDAVGPSRQVNPDCALLSTKGVTAETSRDMCEPDRVTPPSRPGSRASSALAASRRRRRRHGCGRGGYDRVAPGPRHGRWRHRPRPSRRGGIRLPRHSPHAVRERGCRSRRPRWPRARPRAPPRSAPREAESALRAAPALRAVRRGVDVGVAIPPCSPQLVRHLGSTCRGQRVELGTKLRVPDGSHEPVRADRRDRECAHLRLLLSWNPWPRSAEASLPAGCTARPSGGGPIHSAGVPMFR